MTKKAYVLYELEASYNDSMCDFYAGHGGNIIGIYGSLEKASKKQLDHLKNRLDEDNPIPRCFISDSTPKDFNDDNLPEDPSTWVEYWYKNCLQIPSYIDAVEIEEN